jgi:hypothetical protein
MSQARLAFAVNPIHPIQALHDTHAAPASLPYGDNLASTPNNQNSRTGWVGRVMHHSNAAP